MNRSPLIPTRTKLAVLLLFVIAAVAFFETSAFSAEQTGKARTGKSVRNDAEEDVLISLPTTPVGTPDKKSKAAGERKRELVKPAESKGGKSLGEGIGNTSLTWTTGGNPSTPDENVNWSHCADDGHSGKVCVTSGAGGAGVATSWLKTSVEGPCTISFYYKVQTYGGEFRVECDSDELLKVSKVTGLNPAWERAEYTIPAGNHTITFTYKHPGRGYAYQLNGARLDDFKVEKTTGTSTASATKAASERKQELVKLGGSKSEKSLGEGIGNTSLTWTTGGNPSTPDENVNWSYCSDDGHSGKVCVTSGAGGAGVATSWLKTTVEGPCTISFYYKVQTYGGEFRVDCDSDELLKISKVTGLNPAWERAEYTIPAGEHTITFTYKHPGRGYAHQLNGARLDDFKVTKAAKK